MIFTSTVAALLAAVTTLTSVAAMTAKPVEQGAPLSVTRAPEGSGTWRWPLAPRPALVRPFDPPEQPWGSGHRGVDLRAAVGQPVLSPADGTVAFAGTIAGRAVVVVSHAEGLRSTFEPVETGLHVGDRLEAGTQIGRLSAQAGHCHPATCLHWGVVRGGTYLDPLSFAGRMPVVLLPLP